MADGATGVWPLHLGVLCPRGLVHPHRSCSLASRVSRVRSRRSKFRRLLLRTHRPWAARTAHRHSERPRRGTRIKQFTVSSPLMDKAHL